MQDFFPFLRGTMQVSAYYATTLGGFTDTQGRFKVFAEDEAPTLRTPFCTIEQRPVEQEQNTEWGDVQVIFAFHGKDTEKADLWELARQTRDIFLGRNLLVSVNGSTAIQYEVLGPAIFDHGRDPVTHLVAVSVG